MPTHWLALDLGGSRTVTGFVVRHAGAAGEEQYCNTQNFALQSASSISGPWVNECVVDNNAQANVTYRSYQSPKYLRYVRLYITDPGADNFARIPEFEVWGSTDGMCDAQPLGVNLALASSQWQTDSNYSPAFNGSKAIDGVISGMSKWTSTDSSPPHWLALDLGAEKTVTGFIVRHAEAGQEFKEFNTQAFSLQTAQSMSGPWSDECVVYNTIQSAISYRSYNQPKPVRYARLYITDPGIDNYARIPEFEVIGATAVSVAEAKGQSVGTQAALADVLVTGVYVDCFFVQDDDRCSAIRCVSASADVATGDRVNILGTMGTLNGAKVLSSVDYSRLSCCCDVEPLGVNGRSVNAEPSKLDIYVRVWGEVAAVGTGYFVIDDGSGIFSLRGEPGLEVKCTGSPADVGDYVLVTGVLTRELVGVQSTNVVRTTESDVVVLAAGT